VDAIDIPQPLEMDATIKKLDGAQCARFSMISFGRGSIMYFRHAAGVATVMTTVLVAAPFKPVRAENTVSPENAAIKAASALYDDIRTFTLRNGLRVYLKPIPDSPIVTTMVAYKVGSADEDLGSTGLSHYLEHLMFKGTLKIMPGDIDRLTLRNGGENNAYTSEDYTIYHFDFAADRWEPALEIEADRMRNLQIDARHEFQQEKGAVIEELQRNEDSPWDLEQKAILPLLFTKNAPYGHPVIGERQHVRGATAPVIKAHYDRWYHPNNAALVICGGFDPDRAMARVNELFGSIPTGKLPARKAEVHAERPAPVRQEIDSKFDVPRMLMGFNGVRIGDPGYHALEVIQSIFTGGKTGRLYKKLVEGKEIATAVTASNNPGRYPGWFSIQVEMLKGKDRGLAEEVVVEELKKLAEQTVDAAELQRAKQEIVSSVIFNRESTHNLADSIARGVSTNDLEYLRNYLPRIQDVSAEEVQRVARQYLSPEKRVVIWSVPGLKGGTSQKSGEVPGGTGNRRATHPGELAQGSSTSPGLSLNNAKRIVLNNGLTLLLLENHRLPVFVASALVQHGRFLEPANQAGVAALTGLLLDEGTKRHSGPQIAELIENVGGNLSMSSSGGSVQVLSPDRSLGLGLLIECLSQSTFPQEAFARQQRRLLSQIEDNDKQPDVKARLVLHELIFGKHPYGRPALGFVNTVKALTPASCAEYYQRAFLPNNTLMAIVGDFDSAQMVEEIKALTAGWQRSPVTLPVLPQVEMPEKFTQKILTMPDAAQLHFYMGHRGIRRTNPDYFKLLVMDYVLGTGPGFTDRLSARLRDREGLAYTVSANITSSANEAPGLFNCYIGTDPRNFERVKKAFLQEIRRIREEKPQTEEVEDAKRYLLGNLPFQMLTNERIAGHLLTTEEFHLGFNYFEDYKKAVAAVTAGDVQAMARKYLDPQRMVLVAAGPIRADGKLIRSETAASGDQQ
jgi:zinc protease